MIEICNGIVNRSPIGLLVKPMNYGTSRDFERDVRR